MTDEEADAMLAALGAEGFGVPYIARNANYATAAEVRAADAEAEAMNRDALRRALGR